MSEVGRVSYTEEDLENNVTTLKSMGVEDEDHIRRVLRQTSNDITDALHILIPDDSDVTGLTTHSSSFERISGCDIEMDIQVLGSLHTLYVSLTGRSHEADRF
jgi:hypothetical protein